ncbi:RNA 2',3'-cyclic phosphodiesterase [Achromobacter deleyi]|uniref:RNA 2',3'-cyclic phosphodiesterase n=1 Tax=Achromobacter deleyi TaxID=1353891 RepID=UPI001492B776|nr:RNA 2',3'-cyclic phosphodiesterase [Achromobacter deleyi]QVQ25907.1 RNA 2',3'-cyclic phosphodiesterase [Achromobacter deleyi]UIP21448.1 RNA 2',3'-cyclic phosphodiesterase [Achromobacter deleyi]
MSTVRLFFALWPSPRLAASLAGWAEQARLVSGGRVMRTETLHLTLAFLGPVDTALADELACATPERPLAPGEVAMDHYGVFSRQRILWAGPANIPAGLQNAHDELWQWLGGYGLAAPPQPFRPHVTLLRNIVHTHPPGETPAPLSWRYDRMVLVASESLTGGSRYRIVAQSRPREP